METGEGRGTWGEEGTPGPCTPSGGAWTAGAAGAVLAWASARQVRHDWKDEALG